MKKNKSQKIIQFFLALGIVIFANLISSDYFSRIDLTAEGRYSLSHLTIATMDSLKKPITIKVYLEGKMPPTLKRLSESIRTTLIEMKVYAGDLLQFDFIDPSDNKDLQKEFAKEGIAPLPVNIQEDNTSSQQLVFPTMEIAYNGRKEIIDIFKNCYEANGMANLLKAEQDIEFKLTSTIRRLMLDQQPLIGLLSGHQETPIQQMGEFVHDLKSMFNVVDVNLKKGEAIAPAIKHLPKNIADKLSAGIGFDVLVIVQPDSLFSEREKYEIDQYLMRGGRILWILDQQYVNLADKNTLSMPRKLNLDDMFFKYGFKINYDLVQDQACGKIYLVMDTQKANNFKPINWVFYPMAYNFNPINPISKNLDAVLFRYASSIDTFKRPDLVFSPIVMSSVMSRSLDGLIRMDINEHTRKMPDHLFTNKGNRILGLSIEGRFQSLFNGREAPTDEFAPKSPTAVQLPANAHPTRMVVLADGQLVMKDDHPQIPYMPVDNKTLLMNAIDYLIGDEALADVRAKEVKLRVLNKSIVDGNETYYQLINVVFPVILILLFGSLRGYIRKKKNENYQV